MPLHQKVIFHFGQSDKSLKRYLNKYFPYNFNTKLCPLMATIINLPTL